MSILILMIPLSLLFVLGAGAAFFWAVNHDQFEDMQSPGLLPLSEEAGRSQVPVDEVGVEEKSEGS